MTHTTHPTITHPTVRVTDPRFQYTSSAATDVQATWRRFGWRPVEPKTPSEPKEKKT